jgi:predicted amidohydrolase
MATELGVDLVIGQHVSGTDGAVSLEDGGFRVGDTVYRSGEVLRCEPATIGFLAGDDGAAPEVMRALMLRGANVVVWDATGVDIPTFVLRTRADENRAFS